MMPLEWADQGKTRRQSIAKIQYQQNEETGMAIEKQLKILFNITLSLSLENIHQKGVPCKYTTH